MSLPAITVAVAGGKGNIATAIVNGLLRSKTAIFDVRVFTRSKVTGPVSTPPPHRLSYIEVDYSNQETLVTALKGVQVLISAVVQTLSLQIDQWLLEAATKAGVPRFFPCDYDCDRSHPHVKATAEEVYRDWFEFMAKLEELADSAKIKWTIVVPSEFLDEDGAMEWLGFDILKCEAVLYDSGRHRATGVTMDFFGDCFAAVVADSTLVNCRVPIAEVSYTGLELLHLFEEVMETRWKVVEDVSSAESMKRARKALDDGEFRKAHLAHVLRLNYDGAGAANLIEGLRFREGEISRRSLRDVVADVVVRKLAKHSSP